jgi:serine phosphatase RsbU (regulator of sigma subunit)/anti-sigma regulatory factor (Ser/Thr protein kinase)
MTTRLREFRLRRRRSGEPRPARAPEERPPESVLPSVEIPPDDPLLAFLQQADGPVDLRNLQLDSPAAQELRGTGVELVVPLVSQGELIGLLNLGRRLSDQDYSTDDRKLLDNLAAQAAPAVRVAQLVRQQEAEAQERERMEQELRVATLIQQTLLPKQLPQLTGWEVGAYYQPARAVGGDFYDFIELEDGRLAFVVGDVTDKGVPAAMVMATCRTLLRATSQRIDNPGAILERVNEVLVGDIPPNMFVTCLYVLLEPNSGRVTFANAGHNLPYLRTSEGVVELRATGMPLGLMPGMTYEEKEWVIEPGQSFLLHSDGLVEAHSPAREMFGFPRLMGLVGKHPGGAELLDVLLEELARFTGPDWEQEDDVTLVTVCRSEFAYLAEGAQEENWQLMEEFTVPSEAGNERQAMDRVAGALAGVDMPDRKLERLKTAVSEATMNAIEHGNRYQAELPVGVRVLRSNKAVAVRITDRGGGREIVDPQSPDLEAKLAGEQTPRGWGLFLIKNMTDDMRIEADDSHHTVELVFTLEGEGDGS